VNCWNSENAKGFSTPTRIANIWLLSSIAVVANKLTRCPNTVSVFCHGCSTDLPRHNCIFCTFLLYFQHWPKQWHLRWQVWSPLFSRFVGSLSSIFFLRTVSLMNGLSKDKLFSCFSSWSCLGITLYPLFLMAVQN